MKRAARIALISGSGFLTLAALWMYAPAWRRLDAAGLRWVHARTPDGLVPWAEALTHAGGLPVAIPIAVALAGVLWRRAQRPAAIVWGAGFLGGQIAVLGLKLIFNRTRPYAPDLLMQDFSFPSGHAFTAVVLYGALSYGGWIRWSANWSRGLLALATGLLIGTIGWSRLVLRVHYPTDVLGGYLLGIAWLALMWMALHRWGAVGPEKLAGGSPEQTTL
jgi:undecaprenyl-diphosphatase